MAFHGDVIVKPIAPEGVRWELVESFDYTGTTDRFTVPRGFTTDFASVPRVFVWLLPRYGQWTQAAILHDYLWSLAGKGEISKVDADGIFNRALRELEVPFLRRWIMWAAVRWASGPRSWAAGGLVQFLKMLAISVPAIPIVVPPAFIVLIALVIGAAAEFLVYLPLRVFHRDKRKDVHAPDPIDIVLS